MNKEVNFELAKLLKEKGYDEQNLTIYQDGEVLLLRSTISNSQFMTSRNYTAPTIAEVVMWLYEKHGIWVSVEPFMQQQGNCVYIYKIFKDSFIDTISRGSMGYNSPTEAYEEAIIYTLKKLV